MAGKAMPDPWLLIFSDGTGQRGVRDDAGKNTNIFYMYQAAQGRPEFSTFYDPGLGAPAEGELPWTRTFRNLWSKSTGWGITANIVDCYEAIMQQWRPDMKVGLFGFSRGAYTIRCLGGVLVTCGIATTVEGAAVPPDEKGPHAKKRRAVAQEAVDIYKIDPKKNADDRTARAKKFRQRNAAADVAPSVVGVFDTVKALGLPGIMDAANPIKHVFHDPELSDRVPLGLQALSIDENRKTFKCEPWADSTNGSQVIEQCWFPGVHSDIGGGYADNRKLADASLSWMLGRLRDLAGLDIPVSVDADGALLGTLHNERTGFGRFWIPGERSVRGKSRDIDFLCAEIESRFGAANLAYRPKPLTAHPRVYEFYARR